MHGWLEQTNAPPPALPPTNLHATQAPTHQPNLHVWRVHDSALDASKEWSAKQQCFMQTDARE